MHMSPMFCLSGYGYLHDIFQMSKDLAIARIKAVTQFDMTKPSREDVWIDGEIAEKDLSWLNDLFYSAQPGHETMIAFQAEYASFIDAYSGRTSEDPDHLVILRCKLQSVEGCGNGHIQEVNTPSLYVVSAV